MTFELKGEEYTVKYKLKALLLNEQILSGLDEDSRKSTMMQSIIIFYAFIMANNEGFNMSPEDFIEALDEDPTLLNTFNDFLLEEQKKQALILAQRKESKDNSKNKKKRVSKNSIV